MKLQLQLAKVLLFIPPNFFENRSFQSFATLGPQNDGTLESSAISLCRLSTSECLSEGFLKNLRFDLQLH